MMHSTPAAPTMKDAIVHMEAHGTASQQQDIRKAKVAFALHGIEAAGLNTFPADLVTFDQKIPKLTGTMPGLQRLIHAAGISDNTYRQCWRAARRLISEYTGATAEKRARRAQDDAWTELQRRASVLNKAGVVNVFVLKSLPALVDECRVRGIAPRDLNHDVVAMLLNTGEAHRRKTFRKGLKAIDALRGFPRIADLLPPITVTPAPKANGRLSTLPDHLQDAISDWVRQAAREQVSDDRYEHLAQPLSDSTMYRYRAALSLWVETLRGNGTELSAGIGLADLFTVAQVNAVIGRWSTDEAQGARTHFQYCIDLIAILTRHSFANEASYLLGLTKVHGRLKAGRAAGKSMSVKVRRWCETLLRDPKRIAIFHAQHVLYLNFTLEALTAAKAEGYDLASLSDPARMAMLSTAKRSRAKYLLKRVRKFGVLATYAAIALEGAPFRRENILGLRHTGPKKTIHLHLSGPKPHAVVKFPNEELKNGKWLTMRGEELEPVTIAKRNKEDYAPGILKFYLAQVRPLFPEGANTHCLFPPTSHARTTDDGLLSGTFDSWLAEGSAEIGLPLSSHNFRHGYCSIAITDGRVSMEDLAKVMGDTVNTLQHYYAWINMTASVAAVQKDMSRRRAEASSAWNRVAK